MRRRQFLAGLIAVLGSVSTVVAGCGDETPARKPPADTIRLGMLAPLSGRNSPSGGVMVKAAQLAVRDANAAGGVLGRRVELVAVDDACDPGTAVSGANGLVETGIAISVGGFCSSATVPTIKIFQTAGIPMIIPLSNSMDLVSSGYDGVFLLSGTVGAEAAFAADRISTLGGRRLAVIHDGTSFPLSLATATVTAVAQAGSAGAPVATVARVGLTQGAPDYGRAVDAVLAARADTIYFTGYIADARQLIIDLRARGYAGLIVVGDGATAGSLLVGLNPQQRQNLYGTALLMPEFVPEAANWAARYSAEYGQAPGVATIEAYDAVVLAVDAIRRAGSVDRTKVIAAIRHSEQTSLMSGPARFADDGTRADPRFLLLRAGATGFRLVTDPTVG